MRTALERVLTVVRRPDLMLIGSNVLGLLVGLISAALQARILGPAGRGEIAIALVPGTLIGMLMCFGLPDYFGRRAAQGAKVGPLAAAAAGMTVIIGGVCAAPYAWFISSHTLPDAPSRWVLIAYAVASPILVYGYCATSVTAGIERWKAVAVSRFLPQLITVLGLLVLLRTGPSAMTVGFLLVGTSVFGGLFPGIASGVWPREHLGVEEYRPALAFGFRGWPAGSIALLNQRIDLLLLTVIASTSELGFYAVATTLAAILNAISNSIALPIRNRVVRGERGIVPGASAATAALVLVVSLVVAASLPLLIPAVLGVQFLPAQGTMLVLLLAQVPLAAIVILTQSLIGVGRPGVPLVSEVVAFATTISLVLVWYPRYGIEGAAYANLAGNAISLMVLVFLARRFIAHVPPWRYLIASPRSFEAFRGERF